MKTTHHPHHPTIVAGPCSAENREQVLTSLHEARQRAVDFVRISLWKPRTKPGFDGLKETGIPLLAEAAKMGLNPATEVLVPEQAETILSQVLPVLGEQKLMLWIGARNQNHYIQQEIARVAASDPRVHLMVKNQPWTCESHWEGIVAHVLEGGIEASNVVLCHRGFTPNGHNPEGWRNRPDSAMAMRIKEKTGMKMLLDLSHIAGHSDKIIDLAHESVRHTYDGMVVEVHPNPRFAWTDARQQITWPEFDEILTQIAPAQQPVEKVVMPA